MRKLNRKCSCNSALGEKPTKTSSGIWRCARKARYGVFVVDIRKTIDNSPKAVVRSFWLRWLRTDLLKCCKWMYGTQVLIVVMGMMFSICSHGSHQIFLWKHTLSVDMQSAGRAPKSCLIKAILLALNSTRCTAGFAVRSHLVCSCCSVVSHARIVMPSGQLLLSGKPALVLGFLSGERASAGLPWGKALHNSQPGPASPCCPHLWGFFPVFPGFNRESCNPAQSRAAHPGCGP